jgi:hypothetical protein
MITIVGKSDGPDRWYRSERREYVTRATVGDIIQDSFDRRILYRVSGNYGNRPASLWLVTEPAVNDAVIDTDYRNTVDDMSRPCDG